MKGIKNKLKENLILIITIMVITAVLVFIAGYIISLFESSQSINGYSIVISFIGIFSTFGGAYLGAKISGDNARKLYEVQKDEIEKRKFNKIEVLTNIKLIKVYTHSKCAIESSQILYVAPKDERSYDKIVNDEVMSIFELIDGYANPIVELLEDRELYDGSPRLYRSILNMFNECNRMYRHVMHIDIKDKTGIIPEDYNNLNDNERNKLLDKMFEYKDSVRRDIIINFIEFIFIEEILDECANDILNNISEENRLVNYINFKHADDMRYTIDL